MAIRDLSKPEFDTIDAVVMRCAYATQNTLGRLCDERVYENDLALRLRAEGFTDVHTQVPVIVFHNDFEKTYRLDLVVACALYELKTAAGFVGEHDAQVLHYAMMLAIGHGKLLNFRPTRVQGRLRFNAVSAAERRQIVWDTAAWHALTDGCQALHDHARAIIEDWGAYLDARLYEESLIHFCGGENQCVQRVPVARDGHELGTHRIQTHAEGMFFLVTALTQEAEQHEAHIRRLLQLTGLQAVQWINLNHNRVQFITVKK